MQRASRLVGIRTTERVTACVLPRTCFLRVWRPPFQRHWEILVKSKKHGGEISLIEAAANKKENRNGRTITGEALSHTPRQNSKPPTTKKKKRAVTRLAPTSQRTTHGHGGSRHPEPPRAGSRRLARLLPGGPRLARPERRVLRRGNVLC